MFDAFYGIQELEPHQAETDEEKKARLGVTPELVKSYIDHLIKACEEIIDANELLVGKIRDHKVVQHTNEDMSEEDNDVVNEPHGIRDETTCILVMNLLTMKTAKLRKMLRRSPR